MYASDLIRKRIVGKRVYWVRKRKRGYFLNSDEKMRGMDGDDTIVA